MKRLISFALAAVMALGITVTSLAAQTEDDMRAVWVASVYNIDFPSAASKGNAAAQKGEIDKMMESYKAAGLNAVIFQVRPKNDALYESQLNPWSDVLTGTQGQNPGYDPLAYAIESAHKNGLELHAWLNPYRVTTSGTDLSVLSDDNAAKKNPSWVFEYNNALYLDPANTEVQNFISDTVKEILQNYNVDGIHFDDYFYPTNYPLSEGDRDGEEGNQRRTNVNNLISKVSNVVKTYGSGAVFGVSPIGIYKSVDGSFRGSESYYAVFADTLAWINNGWVDYVTPQVYWETNHATAPYENVVKWWNDQVSGTGVKLYIGEAVYKDAVAAELGSHLQISSKYSNIKGHFYYNASELLGNRQGALTTVTNWYGAKGTAPVWESPEEPQKLPEETTPPVTPTPPVVSGGTTDAFPTNSTVMVDGIAMEFEAYNINDFNYFKLRDIAYAVNGSEKQFNTLWDENTQAINLALGTAYEVPAGGQEMGGATRVKKASRSTAQLYAQGTLVQCEAYNIDGNNYYKLRDVAQVVDFAVTWSDAADTIGIVTLAGYTAEGTSNNHDGRLLTA